MSSSPLAAMHHASVPTWGPCGTRKKMRSPGINVRDQLLLSQSDYFSDQNVRGSSPSMSLAADISENFRIDNDASPRLMTPRRALFTSRVEGNLGNRAFIAMTPPNQKAASSPMSLDDAMDISPIPEKESCSTTIEITSPTPVHTPGDQMMIESPLAPPRQATASLEPPKFMHDNRRRLGSRRPSLTRTKGYTTSALLTRGDIDGPGSSPAMTPGECFQDSSPPRPQSANSPPANGLALRSKTQFAREIRHGSPSSRQTPRRPSNPFDRSRRHYRRALSMFENAEDVHDQADEFEPEPEPEPECSSSLDSAMEIEEIQKMVLPHHYTRGQSDSIPRITRQTFLDLLDGKYHEEYTHKVVIDCRFEYEYEGGHIDGAINYNNKDLLLKHLFEMPMAGKTLLIFHCEYSVHRAPLMARHVRSEDRHMNSASYPKLTYPDVYVLEGGYSKFFDDHRDRCYPQSYVEMNDVAHMNTCERELDKLSYVPKHDKRKGLNRAQTFAFGDRDSMIEDSPTAPGRRVDQSPVRMIGNSPILGRSPARRMASY